MNAPIAIPIADGPIGLCADIHGCYERVLAMREQRPDVAHWFCARDVTDMYKALHYNQPTLRVMHRLGIPSVLGNHDYYVREKDLRRLEDEARDYLRRLPFSLTLRFGPTTIRIYHATPTSRDDFIARQAGAATYRSLFGGEEADVVVLGHTHEPYVKRFGGVQFINPGALGVPGVPRSYCVLHGSGEVEFEVLR